MFSEISYLRSTSSELLVTQYGDFCKGRFDPDGIAVVIGARDEALDIPATLISLALNHSEVFPIVVENGSEDNTAEIAKRMGAKVLESPIAAKMAAIKMGTEYAVKEMGKQDVLYTDADTLVGKAWARTMSGLLISPDNKPIVACGPSVTTHSGHPLVDAVRSGNSLAVAVIRNMRNQPPHMRGANMALHFNDRLYDTYQKIRPNLFVREEYAVLDTVIALGGVARWTIRPKATVFARGDRIETLRDLYKLKKDSSYRSQFYEEYDDPNLPLVRYNGRNAFSADFD